MGNKLVEDFQKSSSNNTSINNNSSNISNIKTNNNLINDYYSNNKNTIPKNNLTDNTKKTLYTKSSDKSKYDNALKNYNSSKKTLKNSHYQGYEEKKAYKEAKKEFKEAKKNYLLTKKDFKEDNIENNLNKYETSLNGYKYALNTAISKLNASATQEDYNKNYTAYEEVYNNYIESINAYNQYSDQLSDSGYNPDVDYSMSSLKKTGALAKSIFGSTSTAATSAFNMVASGINSLTNNVQNIHWGKDSAAKEVSDKFFGGSRITEEQFNSLPDDYKQYLDSQYIKNANAFNKALDKYNTKEFSKEVNNKFIDSRYQAIEKDLGAYNERMQKDFANAIESMDDSTWYGTVNKFMYELAPSIASNIIDKYVGAGTGFSTKVIMSARIFTESYASALNSGVDNKFAAAYALASAGVEFLTESLGGIGDGGIYGEGILDKTIKKAIATISEEKLAKIALWSVGSLGEAGEELISEIVSPLVDALLEDNPDLLSYMINVEKLQNEKQAEDYIRAMLGGAISSMFLTGIDSVSAKTYNLINKEKIANKKLAPKVSSIQAEYDSLDTAIRAEKRAREKGTTPEEEVNKINRGYANAKYNGMFNNADIKYDEANNDIEKNFDAAVNHANNLNAVKKAFARQQYTEVSDKIANTQAGEVLVDANGNVVGLVLYKDKENGIILEITSNGVDKLVYIPYGFLENVDVYSMLSYKGSDCRFMNPDLVENKSKEENTKSTEEKSSAENKTTTDETIPEDNIPEEKETPLSDDELNEVLNKTYDNEVKTNENKQTYTTAEQKSEQSAESKETVESESTIKSGRESEQQQNKSSGTKGNKRSGLRNESGNTDERKRNLPPIRPSWEFRRGLPKLFEQTRGNRSRKTASRENSEIENRREALGDENRRETLNYLKSKNIGFEKGSKVIINAENQEYGSVLDFVDIIAKCFGNKTFVSVEGKIINNKTNKELNGINFGNGFFVIKYDPNDKTASVKTSIHESVHDKISSEDIEKSLDNLLKLQRVILTNEKLNNEYFKTALEALRIGYGYESINEKQYNNLKDFYEYSGIDFEQYNKLKLIEEFCCRIMANQNKFITSSTRKSDFYNTIDSVRNSDKYNDIENKEKIDKIIDELSSKINLDGKTSIDIPPRYVNELRKALLKEGFISKDEYDVILFVDSELNKNDFIDYDESKYENYDYKDASTYEVKEKLISYFDKYLTSWHRTDNYSDNEFINAISGILTAMNLAENTNNKNPNIKFEVSPTDADDIRALIKAASFKFEGKKGGLLRYKTKANLESEDLILESSAVEFIFDRKIRDLLKENGEYKELNEKLNDPSSLSKEELDEIKNRILEIENELMEESEEEADFNSRKKDVEDELYNRNFEYVEEVDHYSDKQVEDAAKNIYTTNGWIIIDGYEIPDTITKDGKKKKYTRSDFLFTKTEIDKAKKNLYHHYNTYINAKKILKDVESGINYDFTQEQADEKYKLALKQYARTSHIAFAFSNEEYEAILKTYSDRDRYKTAVESMMVAGKDKRALENGRNTYLSSELVDKKYDEAKSELDKLRYGNSTEEQKEARKNALIDFNKKVSTERKIESDKIAAINEQKIAELTEEKNILIKKFKNTKIKEKKNNYYDQISVINAKIKYYQGYEEYELPYITEETQIDEKKYKEITSSVDFKDLSIEQANKLYNDFLRLQSLGMNNISDNSVQTMLTVMSNETDSDGNYLTKNIVNRFKNSKVRDAFGRLLLVYHGAKKLHLFADFSKFDDKRSFFTTSNINVSASYAGELNLESTSKRSTSKLNEINEEFDRIYNPYIIDEYSELKAKIIEKKCKELFNLLDHEYYIALNNEILKIQNVLNHNGKINNFKADDIFYNSSEKTLYQVSTSHNKLTYSEIGYGENKYKAYFDCIDSNADYFYQNVDKINYNLTQLLQLRNDINSNVDIDTLYYFFDTSSIKNDIDYFESIDLDGDIAEIISLGYSLSNYLYAMKDVLGKYYSYNAGGNPVITPMYQNMENPLIIDANKSNWDRVPINEQIYDFLYKRINTDNSHHYRSLKKEKSQNISNNDTFDFEPSEHYDFKKIISNFNEVTKYNEKISLLFKLKEKNYKEVEEFLQEHSAKYLSYDINSLNDSDKDILYERLLDLCFNITDYVYKNYYNFYTDLKYGKKTFDKNYLDKILFLNSNDSIYSFIENSIGKYKYLNGYTFPVVDYLTGEVIGELKLNHAQEFSYSANTRNVSEYAYYHGYDGVIINNLVDNGGKWDSSAYTPSTVTISFKSNQQKDALNANPTDSDFFNMELSDLDAEMFGDKTDSIKESARNLYNTRLFFDSIPEKEMNLKRYSDSRRSIERLQQLVENVSIGVETIFNLDTYYRSLEQSKYGRIWYSKRVSDLLGKALYARENNPESFNELSDRAIKALVSEVKFANKAYREREEISLKLSNKKALGKISQWLRFQISSGNVFRAIDGFDKYANGIGYKYQQMIDNSVLSKIEIETEAKNFFAKITELDNYNNFAKNNYVMMYEGQPILLDNHAFTVQDAISFVKAVDTFGGIKSLRVNALNGFSFQNADNTWTYVGLSKNKKEAQEAYEKLKFALSQDQVASAYMEAVDKMFEYFKDAINMTNLNVKGYSLNMFENGKYYPIFYKSQSDDSSAVFTDWNLADEDPLNNSPGLSEERTRNYGGYLAIQPTGYIIDRYIKQASDYIAFGEIGRDLAKLNEANNMNASLSAILNNRFGNGFGDWVDNFVDIMTNTNREKERNNLIDKANNALQQGALLFSVSVPFKQISSYWDIIGPIDFDVALNAYRLKVIKPNDNKNVLGVQSRRYGGGIDWGISDVLNSKYTWVGKWREKSSVFKKATDTISTMDYHTVSNVYDACCLQIEKNYPGYSESRPDMFQKLVDAKFSECLLNTQPIYNKQARAEFGRTNNSFIKSMAMFKTQANQNFNRLVTSTMEYKASKGTEHEKEAKDNLTKTITGQLISGISLGLLTLLSNIVLHKKDKYADDEGNFDFGKMMSNVFISAIESYAGTFWMLDTPTKLFIDQLTKSLSKVNENIEPTKEYYGLSLGAITSVTQSIDGIRECIENPTVYNIKNTVFNISNTFGIPARNVYAVISSLLMNTLDGLRKLGLDNEAKEYSDILSYLSNEVIVTPLSTSTQKSNILVNAYLNDNMDKYNRIKDKFVVDDQSEEAAIKAAGRAYLDNPEDKEKLNYLLKDLGKSDDYIEDKNYDWQYKEKYGESYNKSDLEDKFAKGEITEYELREAYKTHGLESDTIDENIKNAKLKKKYGYTLSEAKDAFLLNEIDLSVYEKIVNEFYGSGSEKANGKILTASFEKETGEEYSPPYNNYSMAIGYNYLVGSGLSSSESMNIINDINVDNNQTITQEEVKNYAKKTGNKSLAQEIWLANGWKKNSKYPK